MSITPANFPKRDLVVLNLGTVQQEKEAEVIVMLGTRKHDEDR
jgi:hypothetical protein